MDLQFLQARCAEGKQDVATYMENNHRYVTVSSLTDAHPDLLEFQRGQGSERGLAGCINLFRPDVERCTPNIGYNAD